MLRLIKNLPFFPTQWIWLWIWRDQFKFCNILTLSFTITEFCILILLNMTFRRILIPEYYCLKWDKLWWINRQWHIPCEVYLPLIQKNSLFNMHYLACFGKEEFHSARKVSLKKPAFIYVSIDLIHSLPYVILCYWIPTLIPFRYVLEKLCWPISLLIYLPFKTYVHYDLC